jgi:hypothetical protein
VMKRRLRIFVSYAHANNFWKLNLMPVLQVKADVYNLTVWDDHELQSGDHFEQEIRAALDQMDIFICLVSFDFLASRFIKDVELVKAQQRYENNEIEVIPILLWKMDLKKDCPFLSKFQPLPAWNQHWSECRHPQDAHFAIAEGIKQAVEKALKRAKERKTTNRSLR